MRGRARLIRYTLYASVALGGYILVTSGSRCVLIQMLHRRRSKRKSGKCSFSYDWVYVQCRKKKLIFERSKYVRLWPLLKENYKADIT